METLILNRNDSPRRSLMVVFTVNGRPGSVRFSKTLFANKQAPETLTLSDVAFAAPKVRETPAERKSRLALLPKLTPAERLAKMEERIARMKAKLAAPAAAVVPKAAVPAPKQAAKGGPMGARKGKK
jgi:hypothetical protein